MEISKDTTTARCTTTMNVQRDKKNNIQDESEWHKDTHASTLEYIDNGLRFWFSGNNQNNLSSSL